MITAAELAEAARILREHAQWLINGDLCDCDYDFAQASKACEVGAAALERAAERQRSECTRPHLAPEHAAALRRKAAHGGTPSYLRDAILAALAAIDQRPRLAREHVTALHTVRIYAEAMGWSDGAAAIRAALASMDEYGHGISRSAVLGEIDSLETAIRRGDADRAMLSVQSLRSAVGEIHGLI